MIVDTSIIISILAEDAEATRFADIVSRNRCAISAGSWVEVAVVLARRYRTMAVDRPELLRRALRIDIVPVSAEQARIAQLAYRKFGQGSESPAKLNFGDCFAYALAIARGEPLLFKGDDFTHTDVVAALPQRG